MGRTPKNSSMATCLSSNTIKASLPKLSFSENRRFHHPRRPLYAIGFVTKSIINLKILGFQKQQHIVVVDIIGLCLIMAINTTSTIAKFPYTLAGAIHSQSLQVNLIALLTQPGQAGSSEA
jgi:hypothetical protein